VTIITIIRI